MTWLDHHKASEAAAAAAHDASRAGQNEEATRLFASAAIEEVAALEFVRPDEKPRTFGITAVSAVALYYKARDFVRAQHLAHSFLTVPSLPAFATDQLRELLQTI